mmetsp:Transcript_27679/g.89070  ORF Transcript_27679/g.89070 Transcript_27679/m.89070 type:complete len:244 (+) Transcript_27679:855-1586(+)
MRAGSCSCPLLASNTLRVMELACPRQLLEGSRRNVERQALATRCARLQRSGFQQGHVQFAAAGDELGPDGERGGGEVGHPSCWAGASRWALARARQPHEAHADAAAALGHAWRHRDADEATLEVSRVQRVGHPHVLPLARAEVGHRHQRTAQHLSQLLQHYRDAQRKVRAERRRIQTQLGHQRVFARDDGRLPVAVAAHIVAKLLHTGFSRATVVPDAVHLAGGEAGRPTHAEVVRPRRQLLA